MKFWQFADNKENRSLKRWDCLHLEETWKCKKQIKLLKFKAY